MQPERIREPNPDAEDEAYEADVQRKLDDEMEAKRRASGYSPEQLLAERPKAQPCHACAQPFTGAICPFCREERPAYTALKNITRRAA